ncbi:hypothetical protein FRB95_006501 [Tulasnella sp. JGI-2019a]|nr:hypothetical protein FRB95_006501 [Tulasnella sp. JGI-2019a]
MDISTLTHPPEPDVEERREEGAGDDQPMSPLLNTTDAPHHHQQQQSLNRLPQQQQQQQRIPDPDPYSAASSTTLPPKYPTGVSDYFNASAGPTSSMDPQQQMGPSGGGGYDHRGGPGHAVLSRTVASRASLDSEQPQLVSSIDATPYPLSGVPSSSMSLSPTISTSAIPSSHQQLSNQSQMTYTSTFQTNAGATGDNNGGVGTSSETSMALERLLQGFWDDQIKKAEKDDSQVAAAEWYKHPNLPLARIKKVMKSDPDVKMIGSDAPVLFAKACEIFITEVTSRAWLVAAQNKRRTLSRVYVAKALAMSDQFDFLIDIVPREVQNEKTRAAMGGYRNPVDGADDGEEDGEDDGAGEGGPGGYEGGDPVATYGGEEGDMDGELGGVGGVPPFEQDYDHDGEALEEGE